MVVEIQIIQTFFGGAKFMKCRVRSLCTKHISVMGLMKTKEMPEITDFCIEISDRPRSNGTPNKMLYIYLYIYVQHLVRRRWHKKRVNQWERGDSSSSVKGVKALRLLDESSLGYVVLDRGFCLSVEPFSF